MNFIKSFRDGKIAKGLVAKIAKQAKGLEHPLKLMEVCGTHTMAIAKFGLKTLLPANIKLVSGPGCPVCVTPTSYVDLAIELANRENFIICTFGDMIRVPGSRSSLTKEREKGADIRILYSPIDAIEIAKSNSDKEIVFLAVGFETTVPVIASSILTAKRESVDNFSLLVAHKTMPEPMKLLTKGEFGIDGYICPAHVSAIIGEDGYRSIVETAERKVPCVITGFEPLDILHGINMIVDQILQGRAEIENQYSRVVTKSGNLKALSMIKDIFVVSDATWRGVGVIKDSGLSISDKYKKWDAASKFKLTISNEDNENKLCKCGEILKGLAEPLDCKIFGTLCTPDNPIGACMVSSEGACASVYRYGGKEVEVGDDI